MKLSLFSLFTALVFSSVQSKKVPKLIRSRILTIRGGGDWRDKCSFTECAPSAALSLSAVVSGVLTLASWFPEKFNVVQTNVLDLAVNKSAQFWHRWYSIVMCQATALTAVVALSKDTTSKKQMCAVQGLNWLGGLIGLYINRENLVEESLPFQYAASAAMSALCFAVALDLNNNKVDEILPSLKK